jgi:hypothetical protein
MKDELKTKAFQFRIPHSTFILHSSRSFPFEKNIRLQHTRDSCALVALLPDSAT